MTCRRSSSPPSSSSSSPPPSTSSSSSSYMSADSLSLAPSSLDFKRFSRRRRLHPRSPYSSALFSLPQYVHGRPRALAESLDESRGAATSQEIVLSTAQALAQVSPHDMPSSSCGISAVDPPQQLATISQPAVGNFAETRDAAAGCIIQCEDVDTINDGLVLKQEKANRKMLMWRAACAMAHAYLHPQHDVCCHELHPHGHYAPTHQLSNGLYVHNNAHNVRLSQSGPNIHPQALSNNNSTTDEEYGHPYSSICPSNDVLGIDEVVNPTQAAEWFGTHFLSALSLVS